MTEIFYSFGYYQKSFIARGQRFLGRLKMFVLMLLGILSFDSVHAQLINTYSFSAFSGTFTSIVGTTGANNVSGVQVDDAGVGSLQIGFNFLMNGTTYTTFYMSSNGTLSLGSSTTSSAYNSLSSPGASPIIAPLWDDLNGATSGTATYVTTGSSPNRVLTVEWLNWRWDYHVAGPIISFQVKLYEGTNDIQFIYRQDANAVNTAYSGGASIGLTAGSGNYISVQSTGTNPSVSATTEVTNLNTKPATGQVYQFHPCTSATITSNPAPSQTICAGNPVTYSVTATGATSYQWQVYNGSSYSIVSNNANYSGATTADLTITPTVAMNNYVYRALVYGGCTTPTISAAAFLMVNPTPTVTTQPLGTTVCDGTNVTFSVAASNTTGYQWQVSTDGGNTYTNTVDGAQYSGSTTTSLTVLAPSFTMNNYNYRAMVTGGCTPAGYSNPALMQIKQLPTITQQPVSAVICPGGSGVLSVGAAGVTLSYQWQVDNGSGIYSNISNGGVYSGATTASLNISGAVTAMNNYNYRAVVSGDCTPSVTSAPASISVTVLAAPLVTPLSATTFCPGNSVTLNATYDPALTYQWLYNGNAIYNSTTNTYTTSNPGSYALQVTNIYGCTAVSSATNVQWLPAPVVNVSAQGDTVFCQGNSVTLYGSIHSGYSYYWKLNGNYISNANNSTYAATASGNYSIEESDGTCRTTSSAIQVITNPLPSASIAVEGSSSFCPGGSVSMQATTDFGTNYQWYENGAMLNATSNSYTATDAATYFVVVTDANNCSSTSSSVALSLSPVPNATITVGGGGPSVICYNSSLPLQANTGANLSYQWMLNGFPIANATSAVYAATNAGSYGLRVTNEFGCNALSANIPLTVDAVLNPQVTANGTLLCTGAFANYKWYRNNQAITGATTACYAATQDGSYSVMVSDTAGCSKMSDAYVLTGTGVANATIKDAVKIYPNPANAIVHVESPVVVNVTISSLDGRVVLQQSKAKDLNISNLSAGMYMISVYNEQNELIKTEKLVKAE